MKEEISSVYLLKSTQKDDIEFFVRDYVFKNSLSINNKSSNIDLEHSFINMDLDNKNKKPSGLLLSVELNECHHCNFDSIFLFIFKKNKIDELELLCSFASIKKYPFLEFNKIDIDNDNIDEFFFTKDISGNGSTYIEYSLIKILDNKCITIFHEPLLNSTSLTIFNNSIHFKKNKNRAKILEYNIKVANLNCLKHPEKSCYNYNRIKTTFQLNDMKYQIIENEEAKRYRKFFIPIRDKYF